MSAPDHSATRGRAPRPTPFARQHVWLVLAAAGLSLIACGPVRGSAGADPPPCAAPSDLGDGWHSASAADTRMDADALCALLRSVAERPDNIHSLLVARRGQLVSELYRRGADRSLYSFYASDRKFGPGDRHDVRSISKSVVGLLVGIAVAQGTMPSLSRPLFELYPEYPELRANEHRRLTLEHLLTMSSGLQWYETITTYGGLANDETRLFWDWSPVRFVLGRPIAAVPGSRFQYNGGSTVVVADVLVRSTKLSLREFAGTYLFEPLGIRDWEWVGDLYGRPVAFAGLRLRPRDLLKIGCMMLDHGHWQGRPVVPAEWVRRSITPHLTAERGLGYGYFWWTGKIPWQGTELAWGAAFGNGGQRLFIVPELELAVAMTAGAYNDPQIAAAEMALFEQIVATVQQR